MDDDRVQIVFYYNDPIVKDAEPKRICSFKTSKFSEWLRLLHYCKMHEIDFWVRDDDESIDPEMIEKLNCGAMVEDLNVSFGSDNCIQIIEVVLK